MTLLEFLGGAGNIQEYSRKSKVLLFAYYLRQHRGQLEFTSKDVRQCFRDASLKIPSDLSGILRVLSRGRDSPLMKGARSGTFVLTRAGLNEVEAYLGTKTKPESEVDSILRNAIPYLEGVIAKVSNVNQRKFVAEAIACLGVDAKRATVIMMWACSVAHLYDYILAQKTRLTDFNAALQRRNDKFGRIAVKMYDDFLDLPESVFIEVCRSARLINNDVRKILDEKLGIRNTCAHPANVEVHKTKVVNFVEDLVDNVLVKYPIK